MYKQFFIFLLALLSCPALAQKDTSQYIHKHLLRAQSTISPGFLLQPRANNIYIHGNLEYYLDEKISLRGDGFYFVSAVSSLEYFKMNHSLFSGASYHFKTKSHFDPYLGIQPGLAITQAIYNPCPEGAVCILPVIAQEQPSVNPLLSGVIGFNYYAQRIFHIFGEARYVHGNNLSPQGSMKLNEVRFSFGLGFNIL